MIVAGIGCLLAVLQSPASDSLRLLALSLPQTSLVLTVRQRPLAVRDAITESLRRGDLDRTRALATAVGDLRVEANAVGALAGAREERGDLSAARADYVHALALRDRIGDTRGSAADHNNLGLLAQRLGDLEEARRQFDSALVLNRRDGRGEVGAA